MKKLTALFISLMLVFSLAACGNNQAQSNDSSSATSESGSDAAEDESAPSSETDSEISSEAPAEETENGSRLLVVYFSMPETTDPNNMTEEEENSAVVINGEVLGNTQYVAYVIQENTGADIFRIEPKTPYTTNHDDLVDLAKEEQNNNARPELKSNVENLDQYDTIFIGYAGGIIGLN